MVAGARPRILVVQSDDTGPLGSLEQPLREAGCELVCWLPREQERPQQALDEVEALVALGSVAHPTEDDSQPWIVPERALLQEAIVRELPTLAICLGSQLLAQAAGGRVRLLDQPEIGWSRIMLTPEGRRDRLLGPLRSGARVFAWHSYGFELPPGAVALASNGHGLQAIRVGRAAWGLQFHAEVDRAIVERWLALGVDHLPDGEAQAASIARRTRRVADAYVARMQELGRRFAAIVTGDGRLPARSGAGARRS